MYKISIVRNEGYGDNGTFLLSRDFWKWGVGMKWLKNESELFQFLNDMKMKNKVANLDNYILWFKEQSLNNTAKDKYENLFISFW